MYTGADLPRRPATQRDHDFAFHRPDRFWCPVNRQNQQALGADYLGVWMQVRYDYITHVFPGTGLTIKDRAIMRLEPRLD